MNQIRRFWQLYFSDPKTRLSFALSALAVLGLFLVNGLGKEPAATEGAGMVKPDDFIPEGYSLLPLELQNRDTLTSLVGGYAIVDLFAPPADGQGRGVAVARRLKLVRSPQNPEAFAALVPEDEVAALLAHPGPLIAAVQNRNERKRPDRTRASKTVSRIRIYLEDSK